MSGSAPPPGDRATASVLVQLPPADAFRVFTEEINLWWRGGLRYRIGRKRSIVRLEPKLGGRLFESFETDAGERVCEAGRVTHWEPPSLLVFEWRAVNFAPGESTEVEVSFEPSPSGTLVTVQHRGFARLRADHPVRHGEEPRAFIRRMGLWWGSLLNSLREHALLPH